MKQQSITKKQNLPKAKNKEILVIGGVILVLASAGAIYYYYARKKEKKEQEEALEGAQGQNRLSDSNPFKTPPYVSDSQTVTTPISTKTIPNANPKVIVRYGIRGNAVKILQRYLKIYKEDLGRSGPKGDGVDGVFGPKTLRAAKKRLAKTAFTGKDIASMEKALLSLGK